MLVTTPAIERPELLLCCRMLAVCRERGDERLNLLQCLCGALVCFAAAGDSTARGPTILTARGSRRSRQEPRVRLARGSWHCLTARDG